MTNDFFVGGRVLRELFGDVEWSKRWSEARTFKRRMRVVMDFCLERGYQIHHSQPSGRLVVCRN